LPPPKKAGFRRGVRGEIPLEEYQGGSHCYHVWEGIPDGDGSGKETAAMV